MEEASRNLLIFTIYSICVAYVFYEANKSLANRIVIELDKTSLNQQLEEQNLNEIIDIGFKLREIYKLDELKTIGVTVSNKSTEKTVSIDWDQSSITNFEGTGRVIRVVPGMTETPQNQANSIIIPGQSIKAELSNENITGPLIQPRNLIKAAQKNDKFVLRLLINLADQLTDEKRSCPLRCQFIVKKLSWTKAFSNSLKPS